DHDLDRPEQHQRNGGADRDGDEDDPDDPGAGRVRDNPRVDAAVARKGPDQPAVPRDAGAGLSCIVPCKNEAKNLELLLPRLADIVYAVRQDRSDESLVKRAGTGLFYRLINAGDRFQVPAGAGDFRLMDRAAVQALLMLPERRRFMKGLYAWVGFDAQPLPYEPAERAHGRSHFSLKRLVSLSLDGLPSFTTWPLRIVSYVGAVLALLSFSYGGYISIEYFFVGNEVSGWTTIVVTMMFFFGMQMLFIGIIGEYVGRIFEE